MGGEGGGREDEEEKVKEQGVRRERGERGNERMR